MYLQLFSIAQSVAVSLQRVGGLGRHIVTLTSSELDKYQKVIPWSAPTVDHVQPLSVCRLATPRTSRSFQPYVLPKFLYIFSFDQSHLWRTRGSWS